MSNRYAAPACDSAPFCLYSAPTRARSPLMATGKPKVSFRGRSGSECVNLHICSPVVTSNRYAAPALLLCWDAPTMAMLPSMATLMPKLSPSAPSEAVSLKSSSPVVALYTYATPQSASRVPSPLVAPTMAMLPLTATELPSLSPSAPSEAVSSFVSGHSASSRTWYVAMPSTTSAADAVSVAVPTPTGVMLNSGEVSEPPGIVTFAGTSITPAGSAARPTTRSDSGVIPWMVTVALMGSPTSNQTRDAGEMDSLCSTTVYSALIPTASGAEAINVVEPGAAAVT